MRARFGGTVAAVALLSLLGLTPADADAVEFIPSQLTPPPAPPLTLEQRRRQQEMAFRLAQAAAKTKVVCGTTVIPSNPNIDRKLVRPIPDEATKFTLRKVPPAACR